jgi:glucose/arabinose dehydrogenase
MGPRTKTRSVFGLLVAAACAAACGGAVTTTPPPGSPPPQGPSPQPALVQVAAIAAPVDIQHAGDNSGRLFFVERAGRIRVFRNGQLLAAAFLDISGQVSTSGEGGLLGLAFHPNFAQNRRFFVYYTRPGSPLVSVVSEFRASQANPDSADPAETIRFELPQPFSNHNGGQIAFGADGMLYIALGDGGGSGDPQGNGQNLSTLLGALVRIDVETASGYAIPPDNPFAGQADVRAEIWAYGLRNPWRFSFDRPTGRLFLADVGQSAREEINVITRGGNYGWNIMEGTICHSPSAGCDMTGLILPIHELGRDLARSITGGYVYRGTRLPQFLGAYIFGDFITGRIWTLTEQGGAWQRTDLFQTNRQIACFGVDEMGEIYVADLAGAVLQIAPQSQ